MIVPRILAGQSLLDKLRYWVAVPLGAAVGGWLGYRIAQPGVDGTDIIMAAGALGLAAWLGMSSPKPVPVAARHKGASKRARSAKKGHR